MIVVVPLWHRGAGSGILGTDYTLTPAPPRGGPPGGEGAGGPAGPVPPAGPAPAGAGRPG
ncbi:hypothetical protein GCM10018781_64010 [Kitasatospora indigofera]|uniref:Uncharacterized protein n=1 Tax=Kitasatospora indigofera TaxID=67307 RepID=A0A919GBJ0_9ACTN|nr:hypothetical protein GCM10018781_64010 [Kitasatospora indigofera]